MEYAKKSEKSKNKKIYKSQNLAKSGKKWLKNRNSTNFGITEIKPKFLTLNTRITFNCL